MRRRVDAGDALVGVGDARQQQIHLVLEGGHFAAMLGDVGQVGLAARANLVDLLHFGLDGVDQLLASGNRGHALFEIAGELLDLRQPCFDRRQLLVTERHLRSALLELLEHVLRPRQLILGRLHLAERLALPALDAIELDDQFVLHRARPRELFRERLHLTGPIGHFGGDRLARRQEIRETLLLLDHRGLVELHGVDALTGGRRSRLSAR